MENKTIAPVHPAAEKRQARRVPPSKKLWRRVRQPLVNSRAFKNALASLLAMAVRFIYRTNRRAAGSHDMAPAIAENTPGIIALWHGQHLLAPAFNPRGHRITALFSRSADAELNALVAEKLGFGVVRGSGGREVRRGANNKGGAKALITLKRVIEGGSSVAMIADIAHAAPRQAGMGIVTLARLSGRPVIPLAIATSRRKVLEKTWDKTTINLPFGRSVLVIGDTVTVPADADAEQMEAKRREVTDSLNRATDEAYRLVDAAI